MSAAVHGPVDPRLLRLSAPTRAWILLAAALTAAQTLSTVALGLGVGRATAGLIEAPATTLTDWTGPLVLVGVAVVVRAAVVFARRRFAHRAAAAVTVDLRSRLLAHLASKDPRRVDREAWRTTLTTGVEGLGPYLTGFLPALAATVIATPVLLVVTFVLDAPSALIAVVTLPLIPFFMWLVGTLTAGRTARRLADLSVLTGQLMDLVAGLPTLHAVGRQNATVTEVDRLSARHTGSTMGVLRIAFLFSLVLEFLATLSVALMAVGIGFRLLDGSMTLAAGLTVLIIAPEIYAPVREVGTRFHDAQDGLAATDVVLAELAAAEPAAEPAETLADAAPARPGPQPAPAAPGAGRSDGTVAGPLRVEFEQLSAVERDGARPKNLTGTAAPGKVTVLAGPNGSGKTTALLALLGIATDGVDGRAEVLDATGARLSGPALWQAVSYLPQRPVLDPEAVGETAPLSLGQRQLVAFDRELAGNRRLLICDEPTAHLDQDNAAALVARLRRRADTGATVLLASHDPLVTAAADRIVEVHP